MEWTDTAIVLNVRPQGERAALVNVLSAQHGRWAGRVSGAADGKKPWLAPGTLVQAAWRARLEEQLGTFSLEPLRHTAAHVFDERAALLALDYICTLAADVTPERLPLPLLFEALHEALTCICHPEPVEGSRDPSASPSPGAQDDILGIVIHFERTLLDVLGYGLDVSSCAVTGARDDLTYMSPNTGRAVCAAEAEPYADRLLPLPAYWRDVTATPDYAAAARVTGHFLAQHFYHPPKQLPVQRAQLLSACVGTSSLAS